MCKENGVYEVKGNDHVRHYDKTRQDHLPVAQRPRVMEANARRRLQSEHKIAAQPVESDADRLASNA